LGEANRWVARLGGYLGRNQDGPPGAESFGIGLRRLADRVYGWKLHIDAQSAQQEDLKSCV
jgi:hypothetical protein